MRIKRILAEALAALAPAAGDVPEHDRKTAADRSEVNSKKKRQRRQRQEEGQGRQVGDQGG